MTVSRSNGFGLVGSRGPGSAGVSPAGSGVPPETGRGRGSGLSWRDAEDGTRDTCAPRTTAESQSNGIGQMPRSLPRGSLRSHPTLPWVACKPQPVRRAQGSEPVQERGRCSSSRQIVVSYHSACEMFGPWSVFKPAFARNRWRDGLRTVRADAPAAVQVCGLAVARSRCGDRPSSWQPVGETRD